MEDVHDLATAMPHVTHGPSGHPIYQVGHTSFVFFRTPHPDAVEPETGVRYDDVIVFWVTSEHDKRPWSRTRRPPSSPRRFDGHPSVLLRASRIAELSRQELAEVVEDAWLSQASPRRTADWLRSHGSGEGGPRH